MALARERYIFRKERVRKKVSGTSERPRLSVFKSLKHVYVQAIDDTLGATLAFASSQDSEIQSKFKSSGNIPAASAVGQLIAQRCLEKKIKKVVFDRGGRIYHGVIKAVADAAREGGLEF